MIVTSNVQDICCDWSFKTSLFEGEIYFGLRLPVCSCACTISTHLFSCKMILIAMTELLQIAQLEDSGLTSEATDG
jgi:hypothetical protein